MVWFFFNLFIYFCVFVFLRVLLDRLQCSSPSVPESPPTPYSHTQDCEPENPPYIFFPPKYLLSWCAGKYRDSHLTILNVRLDQLWVVAHTLEEKAPKVVRAWTGRKAKHRLQNILSFLRHQSCKRCFTQHKSFKFNSTTKNAISERCVPWR